MTKRRTAIIRKVQKRPPAEPAAGELTDIPEDRQRDPETEASIAAVWAELFEDGGDLNLVSADKRRALAKTLLPIPDGSDDPDEDRYYTDRLERRKRAVIKQRFFDPFEKD